MIRDRVIEKQHLLWVCRHLPRPDGDKAQRRNWRVLNIASRTHRVHLASLLDGGLRLNEWRRLARRTEKLAIVPRGLTPARARLGRPVRALVAAHRFDAVLCDDPALWSLLEPVPADRRACVIADADARRTRYPLAPDVAVLTDDRAYDRLADLLTAVDGPPHPFPHVVVTQTTPLRRAA